MAKKSYRGQRVGLLAVDPGLTSGIAYHSFLVTGEAAVDLRMLNVDQIRCADPDLPDYMLERTGSLEIAHLWLDLTAEWKADGIHPENHFFVFEDFVLRGQVGSTDRSGLSPIRVMNVIFGKLADHEPIQWVGQQPNDAKSRWTAERLKRSGLWTVGLEHGRDATRHAALWVARQF